MSTSSPQVKVHPPPTGELDESPEDFEERYRYWSGLADELGPGTSLALLELHPRQPTQAELSPERIDEAIAVLRDGLRGLDRLRRHGRGALLLLPLTTDSAGRDTLRRHRARLVRAGSGEDDSGVDLRAGIVEVEHEQPLDEAIEAVEAELRRPPRPEAGPSPTDVPPRTTSRILLVEDDEPAADLLRDRLGRAGYDVVVRDNGRRAIEYLAGHDVDLTIVDVRLAGADGFDVLRAIRATEADVDHPVIVITNLKDDAYVTRAFELGANDFVFKPFSTEEMLARVRRLIDSP